MSINEFIKLLKSKDIPMSNVKKEYLYKSLFYNSKDMEVV